MKRINGTLFFCSLFLIISLIGCDTSTNVDKRIQVINKINGGRQRLEIFSDFFMENIDTSFHIQHRSKDNSYHFFYFINGTISGSFQPSREVEGNIAQECEYYQFRDVWKYRDENFYRFLMFDRGKAMGLVLVLLKGEKNFQFSPDSKIGNVERVENINEINTKFPGRALTFSVSPSVLIYFKGV